MLRQLPCRLAPCKPCTNHNYFLGHYLLLFPLFTSFLCLSSWIFCTFLIGTENFFRPVLIYSFYHNMAANRAEFIHRLIPKRHITCGVGAAAIEITSSAGFSLYQMSLSTFRTGNSRVNNNGFVGSAFRTMEIPSIRSILVHHKCPAFFTRLIRFLFRLIVHIK